MKCRYFQLPAEPRARSRQPAGAAAFTLVELLVVIGIIAVLISILLPVLTTARRQAMVVQCSSNMKQVAMGMMMYIQDNKGRHPPCGAPQITGVYPNGWWWANELVRQGYIKNPGTNVYKKPNSNRMTDKAFNRNNPFRCPEGIDEDFSAAFADPTYAGGDYPTDAANNGFALLNDALAAQEGFGIPSWYMLNSRVATGSNAWPGGSEATPFIWFNSSSDVNTIKNVRYQRTAAQVKRSSELIMLVESSNPNWYDQNSSSRYPGLYLRRLGARHGKKSANGANASTNFAFFDGHVGLYPTAPFNEGPANNKKWPPAKFASGTIFWLGMQK